MFESRRRESGEEGEWEDREEGAVGGGAPHLVLVGETQGGWVQGQAWGCAGALVRGERSGPVSAVGVHSGGLSRARWQPWVQLLGAGSPAAFWGGEEGQGGAGMVLSVTHGQEQLPRASCGGRQGPPYWSPGIQCRRV